MTFRIVLPLCLLGSTLLHAAPPKENPVASFYSGSEGYSAWTDSIRWDQVIDMKTYNKGKNDFEKFESARDHLAAHGGGVLYYPAGTYDFRNKPAGRGLMLRTGVIIRGEAPTGHPLASSGKLALGTKFLFPFRKRGGGQVPADWNIVGLMTDKDKKLKEIDNVGLAWVHLVGATVYFGPQVDWGKTWGSANSFMSKNIKKAWAPRQPDGTHPFDPFAGGGKKYEGVGKGRLVFGCVFEDAAVLDDFTDPGYGPDGFHTQRFCARVAVYGSRVLVANNLLPRSKKSFRYKQKTKPHRTNKGGYPIQFDYGKTAGIDVNKEMLGVARSDGTCPGYFEECVVVRDNYVYNHGNKGYNLSGNWMTIQGNRNARDYLRQGDEACNLGSQWTLTLDGYNVSGGASDNLARAFDLAGRNLWIDRNQLDNTGSWPGNDGEGILCQLHGGTHLYSWAITRNVHTKGMGLPGYFGGYDVNCHGLFIGWNTTTGWVGNAVKRKDTKMIDCAFIGNKAKEIKPDKRTQEKFGVGAPLLSATGTPTAPEQVQAVVYQDDAVKIAWKDKSDNEVAFRVDRRIGTGKWETIAYRPPCITGDDNNPQAWVDFTAPPGKELTYRVIAVDGEDSVRAVSNEVRISLGKGK